MSICISLSPSLSLQLYFCLLLLSLSHYFYAQVSSYVTATEILSIHMHICELTSMPG